MRATRCKESFKRLALALVVGGAIIGVSGGAWADEFGSVEPIEVDAKKAELGKRLFFDKRLSGDVALSCATCHIPDKGFSDGLALSKAYPGSEGFRNTPTLINVAHKGTWFHDGRLGTNLNDVTREMLTETYLMNMDMRLMQERLKQDPVYVQMFDEAGYGEPSNGSVRKAIPEYLKTLTSRNAPADTGTMSDAAKNGFDLFTGKADCVACHSRARARRPRRARRLPRWGPGAGAGVPCGAGSDRRGARGICRSVGRTRRARRRPSAALVARASAIPDRSQATGRDAACGPPTRSGPLRDG